MYCYSYVGGYSTNCEFVQYILDYKNMPLLKSFGVTSFFFILG